MNSWYIFKMNLSTYTLSCIYLHHKNSKLFFLILGYEKYVKLGMYLLTSNFHANRIILRQIKEMSILSFIRKSCFVCSSVPNSSAGTFIDFEEKFLPAQSLFGTLCFKHTGQN